jgi:hypothetical protein
VEVLPRLEGSHAGRPVAAVVVYRCVYTRVRRGAAGGKVAWQDVARA